MVHRHIPPKPTTKKRQTPPERYRKEALGTRAEWGSRDCCASHNLLLRAVARASGDAAFVPLRLFFRDRENLLCMMSMRLSVIQDFVMAKMTMMMID
jgi:hypothetical protein